jgi:hypothetical protein
MAGARLSRATVVRLAERSVGDWSGNAVVSNNNEQAGRNSDTADDTDARPAAA